nr:MAG TPA: hypothetical protein [Bacteriophage sp.]
MLRLSPRGSIGRVLFTLSAVSKEVKGKFRLQNIAQAYLGKINMNQLLVKIAN